MTNILVIEDDPDLNDILCSVLESRGYSTTPAYTGEAAVETFSQGDFDMVVSDVLLPGIDGVETLARLKFAEPTLKCIIITGYTTEETPVRAIRLNVDDYIFKPFSSKYFVEIVQRVLDATAQREENRERFGKLFSKYGLSVGGIRDVSLNEMVKSRESAFRSLYVGIRSAYLNHGSAIRIYGALENLESQFRNLLHSTEPNPFHVSEVEGRYSGILHLLEEFKSGSQKTIDHGQPALSNEQFRPLFDAMKSGELSFQNLLYAPLLRKTPASRFDTLRELLELKKRFWPNG